MKACLVCSESTTFFSETAGDSKLFASGWHVEVSRIPDDMSTAEDEIEQLNSAILKLPDAEQVVRIVVGISERSSPTVRIFGSVLEDIRRFCNKEIELWTEFLVYPHRQPDNPQKVKIMTDPGTLEITTDNKILIFGKCAAVVNKEVTDAINGLAPHWSLGTTYYEIDEGLLPLQVFHNDAKLSVANLSIWFSTK